jgi:hypothetical protein
MTGRPSVRRNYRPCSALHGDAMMIAWSSATLASVWMNGGGDPLALMFILIGAALSGGLTPIISQHEPEPASKTSQSGFEARSMPTSKRDASVILEIKCQKKAKAP